MSDELQKCECCGADSEHLVKLCRGCAEIELSAQAEAWHRKRVTMKTKTQRPPSSEAIGSVIPLCINCTWMIKATDIGKPLCKRPGNGEPNPVSGGTLYPSCQMEREDVPWFLFPLWRTCGEKAKYFSPNDEIRRAGPDSTERKPQRYPAVLH